MFTTTDESSGTLVPGNYRNISVGSHGSITLTAPGTYNIACLTLDSFGAINISPPNKSITLNISGTGCASNPISFNSHATLNNCTLTSGSCSAPGVASNFIINYAGTGTLSMNGGPGGYAILNAPNAAIVLAGGADWYGTIMASTINDQGGTNLHFDAADTTISEAAASTALSNATGSYNTLSFRSLAY